jgi:hypothetical protein
MNQNACDLHDLKCMCLFHLNISYIRKHGDKKGEK